MLIFLITSNQNKLLELQKLMPNLELSHQDLDLPEIQSLDVTEVSKYKAKYAYSKLNQPILVEDSGLYFNSLNGLPGPLIKWFETALGNVGMISLLNGRTDRSALAMTVLTYFDGQNIIQGIGRINGLIADTPKGYNGFGWDPIFVPVGQTLTFAEMSLEQKNSYSMRALACTDLLNKMSQFI